MLDVADTLDDLRKPPSNRLHALKDDRAGQQAFPSTSNGVYALFGMTEAQTVSRLQTITDEDWLHNPHAGEMLASEFMEPLGFTPANLADELGVSADSVKENLSGARRFTGELDLRLARYFGMSEGFFLRLQDSYELMEAKRNLNGALDRIVPRAA